MGLNPHASDWLHVSMGRSTVSATGQTHDEADDGWELNENSLCPDPQI